MIRHLAHITISRLGQVTLNYRTGTHLDTRRSVYVFDWSEVPKSCRVIDLRGSSDVAFWRVTNQAQPSVQAKFDACRVEGIRTTTVRYLKEAS